MIGPTYNRGGPSSQRHDADYKHVMSHWPISSLRPLLSLGLRADRNLRLGRSRPGEAAGMVANRRDVASRASEGNPRTRLRETSAYVPRDSPLPAMAVFPANNGVCCHQNHEPARVGRRRGFKTPRRMLEALSRSTTPHIRRSKAPESSKLYMLDHLVILW